MLHVPLVLFATLLPYLALLALSLIVWYNLSMKKLTFFMRKLAFIGIILILSLACSPPTPGIAALNDNPNIGTFGDSWLYLANLDRLSSRRICFCVSNRVLVELILEHEDEDYDTVIILGGICDSTVREMPLPKIRAWQRYVKAVAQQKFPNTEIIIVTIDDMLAAMDEMYVRTGKRGHLDPEAYLFLFARYPTIQAIYDPEKTPQVEIFLNTPRWEN